MSEKTRETRIEERERRDRKAFYKRLLKAQEEAGEIQKTGEAEGFMFVEAAEVLKEAKRILHSHGLVILPANSAAATKLKGPGALTKVAMQFEVTDSSTGYSVKVDWTGHGYDDVGDKAGFMGMTGSSKYFYAFLLQMPFVDMDPERRREGAPVTEGEPGETPEAQEVRNEQDAAAEAPDVTPRHELPLPESDLPEPDWTDLDKPEPAHA